MQNPTRNNEQQEDVFLTNEERQRCEVWTRVMGYHRPVASFNTGKKGEFYEREFFTESCSKKEISNFKEKKVFNAREL